MLHMNTFELAGVITRDTELRATTSGKAFARIMVAINRPRRENDIGDYSDFLTLTAWDKNAEYFGKHGLKGASFRVTGAIRPNNWTDKEGKKHYDLALTIDRIAYIKPSEAQLQADMKEDSDSSNPSEEIAL